MGVFNVHHLITDIIGSFYQVYQWVACIFQRVFVEQSKPQFRSNSVKTLFFADKEAEF